MLEVRRLQSAVVEGRTDEVRSALRSGVDAKTSECGGLTLMHKAAFNGDVETVRALLEQGSLLNMRDGKGQTPLYVAASQLHPGAVQLLLWRRADAVAADSEGVTPARAAAARCHAWSAADGTMESRLALCLDHLAKVYSRELEGVGAGRSAAAASLPGLPDLPLKEEASAPCLRELPAEGNSFFGRLRQEDDIQGEHRRRRHASICNLPTPEEAVAYKTVTTWRPELPMPRVGPSGHNLLKAAQRGDVTVIRELLRGRAEVNQADNFGHTALHAAAEALQPAVVQLLLQKRADALLPDTAGVTPLRRAVGALRAASLDGRGAALTLDALLQAEEQVLRKHRGEPELQEVTELPFFKNFEEGAAAAVAGPPLAAPVRWIDPVV